MWTARARQLALLASMLAATPPPLAAQLLPSAPIVIGDGRLVLGAEVAGSISEQDHVAWFNYTDYEHDALRLLRASVTGEWRIAPRVSFLGELRMENADELRAYAAYLRVRPFEGREIDIQAGRIPHTFGAFSRRLYTNDNPLIGLPLAYQYLLSIRPDAVPGTADDLLLMRARGWESSYPIGDPVPRAGVPLISAYRWDTGVQVRVAGERAQLVGAVTNGSLSNPRFDDNNEGKQVAARVQVRPLFGLIVGASASRGAWLDREVTALLNGDRSFAQRAFGVDAEYSRDHWVLAGEVIRSEWDLPGFAEPRIEDPIAAITGWLEGRYRLTPRFYVAGRIDRMVFSPIQGLLFPLEAGWDANVSRLELGGGWYLQRNLVAKTAWQHNWRDGGRERTRGFLTAQLLYWF
jgi:hypothetical protein